MSTEATATGAEVSGDDGFTERYGTSIVVIFGALVVFHLPVINLINLVPFFKEAVLGTAVVAAMTDVDEPGEGAKYALITGMTAAVLFNVLYIPVSFVAPAIYGAMTGSASSGAALGLLGGLGALTNLIGLIFFSPVGYAVGGVLGSVLN